MAKLGVSWSELQSCWAKIRGSGQFTEGYYVRAFEEEVSKWSNMHAVAYNSAGTGLYGMLRMQGTSKNAGTMVPNNTFYATGAMAREAGRRVHLVDSGNTDLSMSGGCLARTKVNYGTVILTHVGGTLARDYEDIARYCKVMKKDLLEDASHALGVGGPGTCAGSRSQGAVFSLYPTKAFPAGEGGVIVTKDAAFAERLAEFRNYGKYRDANKILRHRHTGFNFRMDEWTAAVAFLQMKRRAEILENREAQASILKEIIPPYCDISGPSNWYKYPVNAREAAYLGITRFTGKVYQESDQLVSSMGIEAGPFANSLKHALEHACLPLDENLYTSMPRSKVLDYLRGASA